MPKVNSKWDGIPDAVKKRQSMATTTTRSSKDNKRDSAGSYGWYGSHVSALPWSASEYSILTDESRGPPNSIMSVPSGTNADLAHNGHYVPMSPSHGTLDEVAYYCPEEPMASGALPVQSSSDTTEVDSLPRGPYHRRADYGQPEDARSASPASSTDSVDTIVRDTADVLFKKMNDRPQQQSFWGGDAPAVQAPSETDTSVPESHDFLFKVPSSSEPRKNDSPMASPPLPHNQPSVRYTSPPAHYFSATVNDNHPLVPHYSPSRPVHNFSRPMSPPNPTNPFQHAAAPLVAPPSVRSRAAMSSGLPTLYETSIASTESLETIRDDSDARSIAPSVAPSFTPSSIAPSELSEHWQQSSRDRLGLGGQLRKGDVLPWKTTEDSIGKPKRHRLSMLLKGR